MAIERQIRQAKRLARAERYSKLPKGRTMAKLNRAMRSAQRSLGAKGLQRAINRMDRGAFARRVKAQAGMRLRQGLPNMSPRKIALRKAAKKAARTRMAGLAKTRNMIRKATRRGGRATSAASTKSGTNTTPSK